MPRATLGLPLWWSPLGDKCSQSYSAAMEPGRLDDEAAAAFARDGVACVRSVLDPAEVAAAVAAIDAVLARPGPLAQVASSPGDPGAFTRTSAGGGRSVRSSSWPGTPRCPPWPPP